jgi:PAS domain S-box-containing protein
VPKKASRAAAIATPIANLGFFIGISFIVDHHSFAVRPALSGFEESADGSCPYPSKQQSVCHEDRGLRPTLTDTFRIGNQPEVDESTRGDRIAPETPPIRGGWPKVRPKEKLSLDERRYNKRGYPVTLATMADVSFKANSSREALDRMTEKGDAVFAIDNTDHIVFWNKKCEEILGYPAQKVLGRYCFDVMAGRDANGNVYCYRNCPVAHQARDSEEKPVERFTLFVRDAAGVERRISTSLFAPHAVRAELSTVVHAIKEIEGPASPLEIKLAAAAAAAPSPRSPMEGEEEHIKELTSRQKEILRFMTEGLPTAAIALRLFISPVTVRNHVQNILQKLDVHTKLAAVVYALHHNML